MIPGVQHCQPKLPLKVLTPLSLQRTCIFSNKQHMNRRVYVMVTAGLGDRALLWWGLGSGTDAAHGYFHSNRLQMVLLSIAAELPLEKHSALLYRDRVVVVVLRWEGASFLVWAVLDEDASWTQTLSLGIGGRIIVLVCLKSGKEQDERLSIMQTKYINLKKTQVFPFLFIQSNTHCFYSI